MQRLRLEHAAHNEEMKARLAREALAQFDDRRRLLAQEELVAAKRKIQKLEAHVHLPPSKKQTVRLSGRSSCLRLVSPVVQIQRKPKFSPSCCVFLKTVATEFSRRHTNVETIFEPTAYLQRRKATLRLVQCL